MDFFYNCYHVLNIYTLPQSLLSQMKKQKNRYSCFQVYQLVTTITVPLYSLATNYQLYTVGEAIHVHPRPNLWLFLNVASRHQLSDAPHLYAHPCVCLSIHLSLPLVALCLSVDPVIHQSIYASHCPSSIHLFILHFVLLSIRIFIPALIYPSGCPFLHVLSSICPSYLSNLSSILTATNLSTSEFNYLSNYPYFFFFF